MYFRIQKQTPECSRWKFSAYREFGIYSLAIHAFRLRLEWLFGKGDDHIMTVGERGVW